MKDKEIQSRPDTQGDCADVEAAWQGKVAALEKELERTTAQLIFESAERQKLAQSLHDAVNQSLFSAGLIAEVLPRLWVRDPEAARRSLEDLRRLTFGASAEIRILLAEARPSVLVEMEMGDLLRLLGNVLAGRLNIPVDVKASGKHKLPASTQISLYSLCRDYLNILAHSARASHVTLQLKDGGRSTILVQDSQDVPDVSQAPLTGKPEFAALARQAEMAGIRLEWRKVDDRCNELAIHWRKRARKEKQ